MKLTVFGATGGVGRELVSQALAAGHRVCAYVRNPAKLDLDHPELTVIAGELTDAAAVRRAVAQVPFQRAPARARCSVASGAKAAWWGWLLAHGLRPANRLDPRRGPGRPEDAQHGAAAAGGARPDDG